MAFRPPRRYAKFLTEGERDGRVRTLVASGPTPLNFGALDRKAIRHSDIVHPVSSSPLVLTVVAASRDALLNKAWSPFCRPRPFPKLYILIGARIRELQPALLSSGMH